MRELERQVAALLFERLAMNKSPEQILALARQGQQISVPSDVLKDVYFAASCSSISSWASSRTRTSVRCRCT